MNKQVDPITLEVVRNNLIANAEEIATVLVRTAYNIMIFEVQDFCVGILDENGDLMAQNKGGLPIFLSDMSVAVKDGIEKYGIDGFNPGDVIIMNYPYVCGQHLNNVVIYTPTFYDGKVVGFPAVRAHWVDIGGARVGFNSRTTEIYAEGLQFRSIKIYDAGKPNDGIFQMIRDNLRFPDAALGDLRAQIAACHIGERRLYDLVAKYGHETVRDCVNTIWDQSDRLTRNEIRKIKNGEYYAESLLDDDGEDMNTPIPIKVKVIVQDESIVVDFSEIVPQVKGFINCGYSGGLAAAKVALKNVTLPFLPVNEGCFRPLSVILPEGCMLNAQSPASLGEWSTSLPTVIDTIIRALAPALPEVVPAAHKGDMGGTTIHGYNPRTDKRYVSINIYGGGWGGKPHEDGENVAQSICQGSVKNVPVEVEETYYPFLIERFSLREGSGGAGKFRGGMGADYIVQVLHDAYANFNIERNLCPPWGIWGGGSAALAEAWVRQSPDEPWQRCKKEPNVLISADGSVRWLTAGGGGFGDPLERNKALIESDLREGYITKEQAEKDYGYTDE
jgi:N-methylhydantoinase B